MQHLTLNEARHVEKLWRRMHRELTKASENYGNATFNNNNQPSWEFLPGINMRQHRRLSRAAAQAQINVKNYKKHLREKYRISNDAIIRNVNYYIFHLPGLRTRLWNLQSSVGNVLAGRRPGISKAQVNEAIRNAMRNQGASRRVATRQILHNIPMAGARAIVAVRTLQRAFRAKRAAKKSLVHAEMRTLRNVPVTGIRVNNGNVRALKPSDIKAARQYLAAQGFRTVVRRTPKRTI